MASVENFPYGEWQKQFLAAMIETDLTKLVDKLHEAEAAIFERFQNVSTKPETEEERIALDDAIRSLLVLKRETLRFPDWA